MTMETAAAPRRARPFAPPMALVRPVVSLGLLFGLWEIAARTGTISAFLFPPPTAILASLWVSAGPNGDPPYGTLLDIAMSLYRLLAGVGLALVLGSLIGLAIGLTRWGRAIFKPIISAIMPIPTLAWTPILLLVFGIDNRTTITVVFIAASFEIIYNVVTGIEMMTRKTYWVAASMGASRIQTLRYVIIPGILPYLITGLKLGVGYAWRALIAAEMLAASSHGLGFMIYDAQEYMDMKSIYGGILTISVLGLLIERGVVGALEKRTIEKWGVNVER
ncbi:ABC transporter permease [Cereibacter sphaeroides]|uniref:ABC transporter permease n=1 Tax=Cereibacter sphaeroides TaxID=1063 RepID=UPI00313B92F3